MASSKKWRNFYILVLAANLVYAILFYLIGSYYE